MQHPASNPALALTITREVDQQTEGVLCFPVSNSVTASCRWNIKQPLRLLLTDVPWEKAVCTRREFSKVRDKPSEWCFPGEFPERPQTASCLEMSLPGSSDSPLTAPVIAVCFRATLGCFC